MTAPDPSIERMRLINGYQVSQALHVVATLGGDGQGLLLKEILPKLARSVKSLRCTTPPAAPQQPDATPIL